MKPPHYCRYLTNKAFFFPPPVDVRPEEGLHTPCRCNQTQETLGPDGALVCVDACSGPGRSCYLADVEL
ncbi:MAG: hypothetical protein KDD82_07950 [Planctomycetes bacterium]|nr:hypothetical protein [Planctomycetota bacterium]